jgi:hypothetical protein
MSRELSEVRRQKTPRPRKELERFVRSMQRITLDNSIARNRLWGFYFFTPTKGPLRAL